MPVSEATYRQLSLEDDDTVWELVCGRLREKPPMTQAHGDISFYLGVLLQNALPRNRYRVLANHAPLRTSQGTFYVPDIAVIPASALLPMDQRVHELDEYAGSLPLVVEVWSPSTGRYDVREKLPAYRERGDGEIWLVHPIERTLRAWRRQGDGSYTETTYGADATVEPATLPGVRIELAQLFE